MRCRYQKLCSATLVYNLFIITSLIECTDYMTLSDPTRAQSFVSKYGTDQCDRELSGWYRISGKAGDRMPDSCTLSSRCGTAATGWFKGAHPTVADGVVQRKACFSWQGACCRWSTNINVRNCGGFYVYKFGVPPLCQARYCGNG